MIRNCTATNHECLCDDLNDDSMALVEGGSTIETWLRPPIDTYMKMYAFHIKNPDDVMLGRKAVVEEVGPFVYKIVTLKDTDNNIQFLEDGTLSYRQRKLYIPVPELSQEDPDKTFVTVPNIPYWTGMNKVMKRSGFAKSIAQSIVEGIGLNQPFINVSFSGLLWGYHDDLPCLKLGDPPRKCTKQSYFGTKPVDPFAIYQNDDPFEGYDDFGWGDEDEYYDSNDKELDQNSNDEPPKGSAWDALAKPKEEFVDCKCEWGLMRDLNVTMRKPIRFHSGVNDNDKKGLVTEYDGKRTFGWWKKGSTCDQVKGQDGTTLPSNIDKNHELDIFLDFMCRTIKLKYEKDVNHGDIQTYRFTAPVNTFGRLILT